LFAVFTTERRVDFLYTGNGQYQTDKQGEASVSTAALLQAAGTALN